MSHADSTQDSPATSLRRQRARRLKIAAAGLACFLGLAGVVAIVAVPEFRRVRNRAIENTILGDSRQISSAANQYFNEKGQTSVTLDKLVGPGTGTYISGLSSGIRIRQGAATTNLGDADEWRVVNLKDIVLSADPHSPQSIISIGHRYYDSTLSGRATFAPGGTGGYDHANFIIFSVNTGAPLSRTATTAATPESQLK